VKNGSQAAKPFFEGLTLWKDGNLMDKGYFWILLSSLILLQCSGTRPSILGVVEGKLPPCPASPNCVSSQSPDKAHYIDPLRYQGTMAEARQRLLAVISTFPRTKITSLLNNYILCEFTSALFRFVDDVEFYIDDGTKTIHLRSASRVGYSDLGVNRKRMEEIRKKFKEGEQP
jgi:uncharacterized protein (DUF1499 family)